MRSDIRPSVSLNVCDRAMPSVANDYHAAHVACLLTSLRRWTGRDLVSPRLPIVEQARQIFHAPFALLSHDGAADQILNYANLTGLILFDLTWDELLATPSRLTAESAERAERARLLDAVTRQGFVDDYRGVRVSKDGRRFLIERATVWNVIDEADRPCGQAATFSEWKFIADREK